MRFLVRWALLVGILPFIVLVALMEWSFAREQHPFRHHLREVYRSMVQ